MALDWLRRRPGSKSGSAKDSPDGMMRMLTLTAEGRAALARGHATQARQILEEKHKLVLDYWGESSVFAATSAVDLADACLACGDSSEGDQLLEWALKRYRTLEVDDERLLRAELAWATSAYQAADYRIAEQRFQGLIEHYRAAGVEHDVPRAMAQDYLAQVYLRQSRANDAEPLLLDSLAIFEGDGSDPGATAVCLSLLARLRYMDERYREAEQLQRRAIAIHEASDDEINLAKELDHLGASLAMRAQREQRSELAAEAAEKGERAVAIFEKYLPPNHYSVLGSKQNLTAFRSLAASIGQMFPSGDKSNEIARPDLPDGHPVAIIHTLERASQHAGEHDYEEALMVALAARERAIRYFGPDSSLAAHAFATMITILRQNCSYLLGEPTGMLSPLDHMMMQMRAHSRRGVAEDEATPVPHMESRQRSNIERLLREAIALMTTVCGIESSPGVTSYPTHIRHLFRTDSDLASNVLEILHYTRWLGCIENRKAAEIAFQVMQLHSEGPAAEGLASAARSSSHDASHRELRERHRLAILDRDSLVRSLVEAGGREAAESAVARSKLLPGVEETIADLERQLQEAGDPVASAGAPLSLSAVQTLVHPGEALLATLVGRRAIFLLAATADGLSFKRVEMEEGLVRVMCEAVLESTTLNEDEAIPDFDLINALQIHDLVLDPVHDFLGATSHLLFVPDGPLWSIPLQCLVTEPVEPWNIASSSSEQEPDNADGSSGGADGAEEDDGLSPSFPRSKQRLVAFGSWVRERTASEALSTITQRRLWVADRYAISVMPSLVPLLGRSSSAGGGDRRRSFLGIGDPTINRALSPDLAAVPETRQILTSFAEALDADPGQDIIAGNAATLDRLVDLSESGELAARRVICFATHATYPRDDGDPLTEAGLVFSNGELLTAFDVVGLRIDADLVLLTACFTGAPSGRSVTVPLSGLAQAFLKAGARCLLVSHWPVDAEATGLFASRFAAEMAASSSLAAALRAAEDHLRGQPRYSQPAFWSGFSIIGDGAKLIIPTDHRA